MFETDAVTGVNVRIFLHLACNMQLCLHAWFIIGFVLISVFLVCVCVCVCVCV